MLAAQRAYSDAKRWIASARPRRVDAGRFASRAFSASFVAGIVVLGVFGLLAPSRFGAPGSAAFKSGWPALVLAALVVLCALFLVSRLAHTRWLLRRMRDPFSTPLSDHPSFEGAVNALAACPTAFRMRFALGWVWGPAALALVALTLAFSAAYFVVDAVLARFRVGWGQPLYAVVFSVASWMLFAMAARRLATWRLAASVYKEVSTGYDV